MFTFNRAAFDRWAVGEKLSSACLRGLTAWAAYGGWLSKTDATEHVFGSSGRGSPTASGYLESWAAFGIIERVKKGRATYYRIPREVYDIMKDRPDFNLDSHEHSMRMIADGGRPKPRLVETP